jgi:hypothetical protein
MIGEVSERVGLLWSRRLSRDELHRLQWWDRHGNTLLRLAVALMAVLALLKLGDEFFRLLWASGFGANDLALRHRDVQAWFEGLPVYGQIATAVYPPASYAILWPFLGWLDITAAHWLWAATSVMALVWMALLIVRESGAATPLERTFVVLMLLSMNATGSTIGNGQLMVHILPPLLAGLLILRRRQARWHTDLLAASLFLLALVKPTVSAPFFWLVLFLSGRLLPAVLVIAGYAALTLLAAMYQPVDLLTLLWDWLAAGSAEGAVIGYANVHTWLEMLGLREWKLPASLVLVLALGLWTYRYRHVDPWLLIGVTAIVSRLLTYHRSYDDLLILLPMVALFRIAKRGTSTDGGAVAAGALLAVTVLTMLTPHRLEAYSPPWNILYTGGHAVVWIVVLAYLIDRARREEASSGRGLSLSLP